MLIVAHSLEAVASRIEDVADIQEQRSYPAIGAASPQSTSAVPVPPPPPPPAPAPAAAVEDPKFITAFDDAVINGKLKPFLELSRSFAGDSVKEQVCLILYSVWSRY